MSGPSLIDPPIAVTGVIGHTLGAAAAIEAVLALETSRRRVSPPIANLSHLDPAIEVPEAAFRPAAVDGPVLSNSFGFGGLNSSMVLTAERPR